MDRSDEDQIGAELYVEIMQSRHPLSASEFAQKRGVKGELVHQLLRNLCEMNVAAVVDGDKYINAELAPRGPTFRESPIPPQPQMEVAIATGGAVNKSVVKQTETRMVQSDADEYERVKNEDAFQKILKYLAGRDDAVKSVQIAKDTGIGNSRSAVNRYLHFLKEQGVLSNNGVLFKLIKSVKDEEVKVLAAQLAKKPSGKKKSDSSSNTEPGSGCVHNTFVQNNHYHQYNIQVGDHNTFSDGPKRSDT